MNDLARLRRLSATELFDLAFAVTMVAVVALALRRVSLRAIRRAIASTTPRRTAASASPERAARIATLVSAAARRGPVASTCMARALTLHWLLRLRGIESSLRFGVRKAGEQLEAHVWVEHRGSALMERNNPHEAFAPFDALPADVEG